MDQQINHVSHVSFVYKRENFDAVMKKFGDAFNITDWDGPREFPAFGILQAQSVSTGIEIISPLTEEGPFAEHLRDRGEGFFALIFGVADVHDAARRAQEKGIEFQLDPSGNPVVYDAMVMHGEHLHPSWPQKLKTYSEIPLKPLCGVNFFLGQIEPL